MSWRQSEPSGPSGPRVVIRVMALLSLFGAAFSAVAADEGMVSFTREIRPILAGKCLHCHGPDAATREAELRLDVEQEAKTPRQGVPAIAPGDPPASELWRRITATDDSRMPPPDQPRQLSNEEIELLERWIAAGAPYEAHWAFLPPARPSLPEVTDRSWSRNGMDRFVLDRLERSGFSPSVEADKATLIRRVTLDLTGLPPTPEEVAVFLADDSPGSYERLVDRLLDSPHYGERMANWWLDLARYADSGGYQGDILRVMWPWRDWVIDAFNDNMPFDEFTVEQLAGDLLDVPTQAQRIATGFNRNHRINDEDGIIHEEFRVEYVADRTETTAAVWMGLTFGCARCHDHKYDPISQADYYRLFAFFNSIDESGRGHGNAPPLLRLFTPEQEQRLKELDADLERLQAEGGTGTAGNVSANEEGGTASANGARADEPPVAPERAVAPEHQEKIERLNKQKEQLLKSVTSTMVMEELPEPRETFVLFRGAYDQPREAVAPGVPEWFPPLAADMPTNRLALARWLTGPEHPLTARVIVNQVWQLHFGAGLVRTPEDFGTQGQPPTHPELLDWLAIEFRDELKWDLKALQRRIVTSATYRQSSQVDEETWRRDPENRLLGRGPRFRLPVEMIRDQALSASGLLSPRIGGPSVRPYQPEGLWQDLASNALDYQQSTGADLYRRSLYTFLRRTIAPPGMVAFDMPNREICAVRRPRTNTPLQALVVLNDPTYVEASRRLAERVLSETAPEERLADLFRRVLCREPDEFERELLSSKLGRFLDRSRADPEAAKRLIQVGESPLIPGLDPAEVAAWTLAAGMVFNLDETLTRE
jgi:mono/diheme cytochrome c family protein